MLTAIDLDAVVAQVLSEFTLPTVTLRHEVEDAALRGAEDALVRWLSLPPGQRKSLKGYVAQAARWRALDSLRRAAPGLLPEVEPVASPEELLTRAQEEEAPPAPVPQPEKRTADLTPAELCVLDLRLSQGLTLKAVALAMEVSLQRVHQLEKQVRRKLGMGFMRRATDKDFAAVVKERSGIVLVYREPASQPGAGPKVQVMSAGQREAMEERYVREPARKRAAGICPETDCNAPAYDMRTGRCRCCAARWPARKARKATYEPRNTIDTDERSAT